MKVSDPRDRLKRQSEPASRIVFDQRDASPGSKREMVAGTTCGRKPPGKKETMSRGRDPSLREKMIRINILNGSKGNVQDIHPEQHHQTPTRLHPDRYYSPQILRKKHVVQWDLRTCVSTETLLDDVVGAGARFSPALRQKSVTFSDEIIIHD